MVHPSFPPTRLAAQARIAAVRPAEYARSRNALDGAVSYLSPYLTHGFVTLAEVLTEVATHYPLDVQHKFIFELGWREFFQHVWTHRGDAIFQSLHPGPLPDTGYSRLLPADIREANTGVPVIDEAVRTLYATGTLHNHARMWLASYTIHLRKVHWRSGADWLYGHLLDGDLASNHLSWQWVAGTGSAKPYLFNADNVARYAPSLWHSAGSVVDRSYEALDALARCIEVPDSAARLDARRVGEPPRFSIPPTGCFPISPQRPEAATVAGRDVWLVHPWALGELPHDLPPDCLCLGLLLTDFHNAWPWGAARWSFVGSRMADVTSQCWYGSQREVAHALSAARSVQVQDTLHLNHLWPDNTIRHAPPRLFAELARPYPSFSQWWRQVTSGITHVHDLPGVAALARHAPPSLRIDQINTNNLDAV